MDIPGTFILQQSVTLLTKGIDGRETSETVIDTVLHLNSMLNVCYIECPLLSGRNDNKLACTQMLTPF